MQKIRSQAELSTIRLPGAEYGPGTIQHHVQRFDEIYNTAQATLEDKADRRRMLPVDQLRIQRSLRDFYTDQRTRFVGGLQPLIGSMLPTVGLQRTSQFERAINELLDTELNIDMHNQHMIREISKPVRSETKVPA